MKLPLTSKDNGMDFQSTDTKSNSISCYKWYWVTESKERLQNKKKAISAFFNMDVVLI